MAMIRSRVVRRCDALSLAASYRMTAVAAQLTNAINACRDLGIAILLPNAAPTTTTPTAPPSSAPTPAPAPATSPPPMTQPTQGRPYLITAGVNVRSGPGTNFPQTGSIASGTTAVVSCTTVGETIDGPYGPTNKWEHVTYSAGTGYVSDEYVDTKNDITNRALIPLC